MPVTERRLGRCNRTKLWASFRFIVEKSNQEPRTDSAHVTALKLFRDRFKVVEDPVLLQLGERLCGRHAVTHLGAHVVEHMGNQAEHNAVWKETHLRERCAWLAVVCFASSRKGANVVLDHEIGAGQLMFIVAHLERARFILSQLKRESNQVLSQQDAFRGRRCLDNLLSRSKEFVVQPLRVRDSHFAGLLDQLFCFLLMRNLLGSVLF